MKKLLITLLTCSLSNIVTALEDGDKVTVDALKELEYFKGNAPEKWEEGKVYVIECWASWCPPCIAAIPHMDELYDTYHEKGLEVIGMNLNDKKETAASIVEKKGDGMSYPVAYTEEDSSFTKDWYAASSARGLPHTFIVKGGELLLQMHPAALTNEMVEQLLAPDANIEGIRADLKKQQELQEKAGPLYQQFQSFRQAKDEEGMKGIIEQAKELDKDFYEALNSMYLVFKKDWPALTSLMKSKSGDLAGFALPIFIETDGEDGVDHELLKLIEPHLKASSPGITTIIKSRLHVRLGNNEKALELAKQGITEIQAEGKLPAKPFEDFLKSIAEGNPMTIMTLEQGIRAASGQ